ncbi:MAG TPA: carbon-nitrogen hydrolase family protein [Candidatus Acidoferrales bacterium]
MRVACVEWPENLSPAHRAWDEITKSVAAARPDLLLTNELPFGPWIAAAPEFSTDAADRSIRAHEEGLAALIGLRLRAIISTRPVWNGSRLANEAFVLENGATRALHRKQYFPNEPGWFESEWYAGDNSGFEIAEILGIKVGVLICTEAMFNEQARAYGKQGAALIVIPRATGKNLVPWKIAAAMASVVSGAYVISSNRAGSATVGPNFGGTGFAYAPQAAPLGITTAAAPLQTFDLDPLTAQAAQREYPCYVPERT